MGVKEEKRTGKKPVPDNLQEILNEDQMLAYHGMQNFGWYIKFIRRPLFQRPVCVLSDPEDTTLAIIEIDGHINKRPDTPFRTASKTPEK